MVVLLNCGESAAQLLAQFEGKARAAQAPTRGRMDLRTYGVGANPARCGRHAQATDGRAPPYAQHGDYALEIVGYLHPQTVRNNDHANADKGTPSTQADGKTAASASCRHALTKASPTRWPRLAAAHWKKT